MTQLFGPHYEQLHAVATTSKLIAVGGRRCTPEINTSHIHLFTLKAKAKASVEVEASVLDLAFIGDSLLLVMTEEGRILGFDTANDPLSKQCEVSVAGARALAVSGNYFAVACGDGWLRLFELELKDKHPQLVALGARQLSSCELLTVAFDPRGELVATGGRDGVVRVMAIKGADGGMREISLGGGTVTALAFSFDGRIVTGGEDGSLRIGYVEGAVDAEDRSGDAAHGGPVRGLLFGPELLDKAGCPKTRRLFSVGDDGVLKAWWIDTKRKPKVVEFGGTSIKGLAWIPAPVGAKTEEAGGRLVLADVERRISVLHLDSDANFRPSWVVESNLMRLAKDLRAGTKEPVSLAALATLAQLPEDEARQHIDAALLKDPRSSVRRAAAEYAGQTNRRRSRAALRLALNDEHQEVRHAALTSLEQLEADSPVAPIQVALASLHGDIRKRAVEKLPEFHALSPLVLGLLAERLQDADDGVSAAAMDGLEVLHPDSLSPYSTMYTMGTTSVRAGALVRAACRGWFAGSEGDKLMTLALDDEEADVRSTAFYVYVFSRRRLVVELSKLDDRYQENIRRLDLFVKDVPHEDDHPVDDHARMPLFAALSSRYPEIAIGGAHGLALLKDQRATGVLLQLSRERNETHRSLAVEALVTAASSMPTDLRLVHRLKWLIDDSSTDIRGRAFAGYQKLTAAQGARGRLDMARLALRAAHGDIRARALEILVAFGGHGEWAGLSQFQHEADALLAEALDDEDEAVRKEAFRTLWAWYSHEPEVSLHRAARSRHPDVREMVVKELSLQKTPWARSLLLELVSDSVTTVGKLAYYSLTRIYKDKDAIDVYLRAMVSPSPEVRTLGCQGAAGCSGGTELKKPLTDLVDDPRPAVYEAAIEAIDTLYPEDQEAFRRAFTSPFYRLRVRAGELCGQRRDKRALNPMRGLLSIPGEHYDRPADSLRQRAARAIADVGASSAIPFYQNLLEDEDAIVREMGARGLAAACGPTRRQPLLDALSHNDLAVRSWVAEGLARLGDARAVPVLVGTLNHDHRPLRLGAILGFAALGAEGVRGLLLGLEDAERDIQDLVLAIVVARDVALARANLPPDLLLFALSAGHPEVRFAAARVLEERGQDGYLAEVVQGLVGPVRPEQAVDGWPKPKQRTVLLNILINSLASDVPDVRYAAARILSLRLQPQGFWREAELLALPPGRGVAPYTSWATGVPRSPRQGWLRRLFSRGRRAENGTEPVLTLLRGGETAETPHSRDVGVSKDLLFGIYAGLIRYSSPPSDLDESHRVRRDSLYRLVLLAAEPDVGEVAVVSVLRRALDDPHHLVRKAALSALKTLLGDTSLKPLIWGLESASADIGRAAMDELLVRAKTDDTARKLALGAVNVAHPGVRMHALRCIERLFEPGDSEPWVLAMDSSYADVRLAVIDRLADSKDSRVLQAFEQALTSEHQDLRVKAAWTLAQRGDVRTIDVWSVLLRNDHPKIVEQAIDGLVAVVRSASKDAVATASLTAVAVVRGRLEEEFHSSAELEPLIRALVDIGHDSAREALRNLLDHEEVGPRRRAFLALMALGKDLQASPRVYPDGSQRTQYREAECLPELEMAAHNTDVGVRTEVARVLGHIDAPEAGRILHQLLDDRQMAVRVLACEQLLHRARYVEAATWDELSYALTTERRELLLPAALGLAELRRPEAFLPLMLALKAGVSSERVRAIYGLGRLGDERALDELLSLVDPEVKLAPEAESLVGPVAEALGMLVCRLPKKSAQERAWIHLERLESYSRVGGSMELSFRAEARSGVLRGFRHAGDERSRLFLERIAQSKLQLEDAKCRLQAVAELARRAHVASVPVLVQLLNESDEEVRQGALKALRAIYPQDNSITGMYALSSRYEDVSRPAATFLAREGDPKQLVSGLAGLKDAKVQRLLRQGLIRREAYPVDALVELLKSDRSQARAEAAWLVGSSQKAEFAEAIVTAVERSEQAWQYGRRSTYASKSEQAANEEAWRAALWAAGRLGVNVRERAAAALAGPEAAPPSVVSEALCLLRDQGQPADVPAIEKALTASDARVRTRAASALAGLKPERAVQILENAVVGDSAALEMLVPAAMEQAAVGIVGSDGARRVVLPKLIGGGLTTPLIDVAQQPGETVARRMAVESLGRMRSSVAEGALKTILQDAKTPESIRKAAFKAIRRVQRALKACPLAPSDLLEQP
ncbi:MAG: HEAT repeat domain-containing protein [Myxococcales bacterium]|nr:HEAT repeat domain-containing protein [Myxococcales bacterium]